MIYEKKHIITEFFIFIVSKLSLRTNGLKNYHSIMDLAGFDYDKSYYDNQSVLEIACKQKNLNHLPNEKVLYGIASSAMLKMKLLLLE